jgi:hypothetical protein
MNANEHIWIQGVLSNANYSVLLNCCVLLPELSVFICLYYKKLTPYYILIMTLMAILAKWLYGAPTISFILMSFFIFILNNKKTFNFIFLKARRFM